MLPKLANPNALIDAKVVQAYACTDKCCTTVKANLQWAPQDTPACNDDAKGALNGHPVGALMEVKGIVLRMPGGSDDGVRQGEGCVRVDEEGRRQLSEFDLRTQGAARPCQRSAGILIFVN